MAHRSLSRHELDIFNLFPHVYSYIAFCYLWLLEFVIFLFPQDFAFLYVLGICTLLL